MKFDKTCCGTTCDAKANAGYVAKLEAALADFRDTLRCAAGQSLVDFYKWERHKGVIKHAQQNHSN